MHVDLQSYSPGFLWPQWCRGHICPSYFGSLLTKVSRSEILPKSELYRCPAQNSIWAELRIMVGSLEVGKLSQCVWIPALQALNTGSSLPRVLWEVPCSVGSQPCKGSISSLSLEDAVWVPLRGACITVQAWPLKNGPLWWSHLSVSTLSALLPANLWIISLHCAKFYFFPGYKASCFCLSWVWAFSHVCWKKCLQGIPLRATGRSINAS